MAFVELRMHIKFCAPLGKIATETYEMLKHRRQRNYLEIRKLPAPLKTSKRFMRTYIRTGFNNSANSRISWDILIHRSTDTD
ncbi:UNVERIFIED_CONTAM: hypothetical protein NCL1_22865 [Trichonephila clavipes]